MFVEPFGELKLRTLQFWQVNFYKLPTDNLQKAPQTFFVHRICLYNNNNKMTIQLEKYRKMMRI